MEAPKAESQGLMSLEVSVEDGEESLQVSRHPTQRRACCLLTKAAGSAAALLALSLGLCALGLGAERRRAVTTAATDAMQDKAEAQGKPCLCLFDVDRTLTARQGSQYKCANTKAFPGVRDPAFSGGALSLSEVGLNLDKTFCSKCHIGIVTAGTAGFDNDKHGEREVIYEQLKAAGQGSGTGPWSSWDTIPPISPLVHTCTDKIKIECAKHIVNWYESRDMAFEPSEVYFFDDHWGNAGEFSKYGYNGREVSCESRDWSIGGGLVGYCGALLSEIVPDKGIMTCGQLEQLAKQKR